MHGPINIRCHSQFFFSISFYSLYKWKRKYCVEILTVFCPHVASSHIFRYERRLAVIVESSLSSFSSEKASSIIWICSMGERRGVHRVLVGKPEGKRPLGRPRRRWEDNIKMDLREVEGVGDWVELAQDRDRWRALLNRVTNFLVPLSAGNFLTSCRTS